jgi:beta-lactamase regulating signal transducer with metallopeptidase domain
MIGWALGTMLAVSALIALVLIVRRPVARAFGAQAAYALWAAPLIRAVIPPLPQASIPVSVAPVFGSAGYQLIVSRGAAASSWSWAAALVVLWLGGAALYLAVQIIRHHRFVTLALRDGRSLQIDGVDYDVVASPVVHGPVATGLIHPLILVPLDFARRFSPEQQWLALLHEQFHHRRGDIWASAAALIVAALLWFNPIAYLALGAFRRDMEAACDSRVLAAAGSHAAPAYAETILRCAASPVPRSLCALTTIDELKGRLIMLNLNHGPARRLSGLILAAGMSLGGLALAVPAIAHQEPTRQEVVEKKVIINGGPHDKLRHSKPGDLERLGAKCDGQKVEITANGGFANKKDSIKLVICGEKSAGAAGLAEALSKAMHNIDSDNRDLEPKVKADLKAKIDAKIRELRARG